MSQPKFPSYLLDQSISERVAYFENYKVNHPKLQQVFKLVMDSIRKPDGASLIAVYGPTGVGKTTLRLKIEQRLIEEALSQLEIDRGKIPVIAVEAVAPESGNFNWKDYYTRALIALEEPLIEHKVAFDYNNIPGIRRNDEGVVLIKQSTSAAKLRQALEKALFHRRPDIFFVDEAQHLGKMSSGQKLQTQLDCLKSLANMTGVLHGLFGTYELLIFRDLSAQLSRRTIDIHFPRYKPDNPQDLKAFKSILLTFQRHLPLTEEPDLVNRWDYFYERSLGCVGILKDWLTRTLRDALEEEAKTITDKHLKRRAWSVSQCKRMLQEIEEGESQLEETEQDVSDLRQALGLDPDLIAETNNNSSKPKKKSSRRVGQRKPKRDSIGMSQNAQ
jgi:AAA domain